MRISKIGAPFVAAMTLALAACGGGSDLAEQAAKLGDPAQAISPVQTPVAVALDEGIPAAAPTPVEAPQGWTPAELVASAGGDVEELDAMMQAEVQPMHSAVEAMALRPLTYTGTSGPYAPADFRAAYAFPDMPANYASATLAQKAAMGAGQTVYVVGAYHDPQTLSYLNAAAQRYGLPTCTEASIDNRTLLPLAAAPTTGCTFSVVGADANGNVAALPAVNVKWGVEESLDVQMVHASAPLARIVVVAAQSNTAAALSGAVKLANRMGNGVVSMSFGATDGTAFGMLDSLFASKGMLYVASSGDSGYNNGAVSWPAAVPTVLAVGGTTLNYDGLTRTESAWSLGGGGTSSWRAAPAYQSGYSIMTTSGLAAAKGRMVPDVSLNADANTGYLVYANLGSGPTWARIGGTSASAPIWAGVLTTANAMRKASSKASLASAHQVLYRSVGMNKSLYTTNLLDVSKGTNGTCLTCSAAAGYDVTTGLGTPYVTSLLSTFVSAN